MINLIKYTRCGKVKGQKFVDESTQQKYILHEEVALPTIYKKSMMSSLVIDAHKVRNTVFFDIIGAYLHAYMIKAKTSLLKLEGEVVSIM